CIYYSAYDIYISSAYFYIICCYFILRFEYLFRQLNKLYHGTKNISWRLWLLSRVFYEYHCVCMQLKLFDIFWQHYYLIIVITLIPLNLLLEYLITFTELKPFAFILFLMGMLGVWVFLFFVSFYASLASKKCRLS